MSFEPSYQLLESVRDDVMRVYEDGDCKPRRATEFHARIPALRNYSVAEVGEILRALDFSVIWVVNRKFYHKQRGDL